MKQRLILFFDGTWNDPSHQTNVYLMSRLIHDYDGDIHQRFFYDPGVGTNQFEKFLGGVTGWGLTDNVFDGYEWLAKSYLEGDEIWVFGFSRGAYTARSLAGLIETCGLLHTVTPSLIKEAEKLYKHPKITPQHEEALNYRQKYSRQNTSIHFMGIWDTVGQLGIPGTTLAVPKLFAWNDTIPSHNIRYAYHALALDENREAYNVALWTSSDGKILPNTEHKIIEQRWFIGAHANVGGGYIETNSLSKIPLHWICTKAKEHGLKLDIPDLKNNEWQTQPRDSFKEFLNGIYAFYKKITLKGDKRFYRHYNKGYKDMPAINISVDHSVWQKWRADPLYRPKTLVNNNIQPFDESR